MSKRYTKEEIAYLSSLPIVKQVKENRLTLTFSYREKLYTKWKEAPSDAIIRKMLEEAGVSYSLVGRDFIHDLHNNFIRYGAPQIGKSRVAARDPDRGTTAETNRALLDTGCFVTRGSRVTFSQDYIGKLMERYPETNLEECLQQDGIDPRLVGYQRIYALKRRLDQGTPTEHRPRKYSLPEEEVEAAKVHPYILRASQKQIVLCSAFYWEAKPHESRGMKIDSILELFELRGEWFSPSRKLKMKYDIRNALPADPMDESYWKNAQYIRIQRRNLIQFEKYAAQGYSWIREKLPYADQEALVQVFEWIRGIPVGEKYQDTLSQILLKTGICRSRFYRMCSNDFRAEMNSRLQKEKMDMEAVRMTADYGGYPKGSRQIYMQMDVVANRHMSRKKIRRLMKKAGIVCPVRKANVNRQSSREFLKTHVKPNLLRRKFRLSRPGQVFLTDVTYLDYGMNRRAYGSASLDAVTGEVIDFTVRSENDLLLVKETVMALPDGQNESIIAEKRILHSDQGVLYLTDDFQETVSSRNLTQSMSKRGNCWDNAPQESFFGHFKDECSYKDCATLEELQTAVKEYVLYYNTQRGQWNRNKMTPEAYREYLLAMDEAQFSIWMKEQEKHYVKMREQAEQKAIERAKTLGV